MLIVNNVSAYPKYTITLTPSPRVDHSRGPCVLVTINYNEEMNTLLKSIPGSLYVPEFKSWEIRQPMIKVFVSSVMNHKSKLEIEPEWIIAPELINKADIKVDLKTLNWKTKPYNYQLEAVEYGIRNKRFILGDEQGCLSGDTRVHVYYEIDGNNNLSGATKLRDLYNAYNLLNGITTLDDDDKIAASGEADTGNDTLLTDTVRSMLSAANNDGIQTSNIDKNLYILSLGVMEGRYEDANNEEVADLVTKHTYKRIDKVIYQGIKPVYELEFCYPGKSRTTIVKTKLTGDHLILTTTGWKRADKLTAKDLVICSRRLGTSKDDTSLFEQDCWDIGEFSSFFSNNVLGKYMENIAREVFHIHAPKPTLLDAFEGVWGSYSEMLDDFGEIAMLTKDDSAFEKDGFLYYHYPHYFKLKSRKRAGMEDVYDIKIDHPVIHNFLADGIFVHNCGKTLELIYLVQYLKKYEGLKRALIVCGINGNKYNWIEEVEKHSYYNGHLLGSHINKRSGKIMTGSTAKVMDDLRNLPDNVTFLVTNVETLRGMHVKRKRGQRKTINEFPIVAQIQHLINTGEIGLVAFDEIHKCKSATSLQSQALMWINCPRQVGMTGTLIMNSPLDLYVPFKWMGWENRDYWGFLNRYAIKDMWNAIVGYQNAQELINVLTCYQLRRLRKNVLELPPKVCHEEYIELTPEEWRVYKAVQFGLYSFLNGESSDKSSKDLKSGLFDYNFGLDPMTLSLRLRQATASTSIVSDTINKSSKLDRMIELVEDVVKDGGKVIIFSNWTTITDLVMKRLNAVEGNIYRPACITGEVDQETRNEERIRFQEDPTCKVIVGTIPALGTGFTLTAANTVIFMDEPWTKAAKNQAEDRAYRAGTVHPVDVYTLIAKDTVDEHVHDVVEQKGDIATMITDGVVNPNRKAELFRMLVGDAPTKKK